MITRSQYLDTQLEIETDDCIEWPYALSQGYGAIHIGTRKNGSVIRVHVIACEREHGLRPTPEHQAAHSCGNHICFNRRHVRWATQATNEADKVVHGLSNRGSRNGQARLNEVTVLLIRQLLASGVRQKDIAAEFSVHPVTISNIHTKQRWGWLE